ncbi:hypothetical protein [uncultured Shewanella sp.]|uniref:hypothetical protein n=1 Tax=uncultured Shewanella sp. TaxID=173975 RepID=UPI002612715A|nr:hypothetical protein [uncultured Shewanella sp.]
MPIKDIGFSKDGQWHRDVKQGGVLLSLSVKSSIVTFYGKCPLMKVQLPKDGQ